MSWSDRERLYEIRPTAAIRTISAREWETTYVHYEKALAGDPDVRGHALTKATLLGGW